MRSQLVDLSYPFNPFHNSIRKYYHCYFIDEILRLKQANSVTCPSSNFFLVTLGRTEARGRRQPGSS